MNSPSEGNVPEDSRRSAVRARHYGFHEPILKVPYGAAALGISAGIAICVVGEAAIHEEEAVQAR
jgi:hypothetical protein